MSHSFIRDRECPARPSTAAASAATVAGTCIAIDGHGVLLCGPSGAGKSDLALRLIEEGAVLVSDDYTRIDRRDDRLLALAPPTISGLLEVRGIGIVRLPPAEAVALALVVELVNTGLVPRLPDDETVVVCGIRLPRFLLDPFEASAPAKVRLAVRIATGGIIRIP